jgi:ribose transport system substrate-binding protein
VHSLTAKTLALAVGVGFALTPVLSAQAADGVANGDTSGKRIALSNNYAGNAWRQAMLQSWNEGAKEAVAKKLVREAPAFTTAENQATEQAAQIQNLIVQGYDAIVINAASTTALNGTVKQACDAGIVVVSFDAVVSEPCAYRIVIDEHANGFDQLTYLDKRLGGKGNILEVRGLAGTSVDEDEHTGIVDGLKKYAGFKLVGSVYGNWTETVAQREVAGLLPTLPKVDGVVTGGGDGYGVAQAFKAAGRPMPIIIMGNRYDELAWWKEQHDANGYETVSWTPAPAEAQIALWVAQQVLAGKDVPKNMTIPMMVIKQADLDYWLARTPKGGIANTSYSLDWAVQVIDAFKAGKPAPETPKS